ncbi:hypothetical protein GCM10011316_28970 [Roseibium aquae]|uniref:Mu-like prophage FluMu N-terminal domain-containing protein n=1 Tax=Roseibium aquae TaxID=1323746 RepID=A0A916TL43_9HYPH|nr:HI1506-related protein [Roseibium aquae]GGB55087.1 hypothetical protein GCM10011316_28970 [Roseibium aquae]
MTQAKAKQAPPKAADTEPDAAKPVLRITAKPRDGFRRCGVHHPAEPVEHGAGRFSDAEIAVLKAEPNLVVEDL